MYLKASEESTFATGPSAQGQSGDKEEGATLLWVSLNSHFSREGTLQALGAEGVTAAHLEGSASAFGGNL